MNYAALTVSVLALLFTVFSFWWMNWRKGKLRVGSPRSYAAHGADQKRMVIEPPFVFFNDGPIPIVVDNLRLIFSNKANDRPLDFVATVEKIGTDEGRTFATQFPVRGRESTLLICEFQRRPGGMLFEAGSYPMQLQAKLDGSEKWKSICDFHLNVSEESLATINKQFLVYDNTPND
jgi:hypothetical protein